MSDGGGGGAASVPVELPDQIPEIGPDLTGLSRAAPAGARPFLVEGGALWMSGTEGRPGFRIGTGRRLLAEATPSGADAAANILAFPGVVRRDFAGSEGPVVESLVASGRLPLVAAQWTGGRSDGSTTAAPIRELSVALPAPEAGPPVVHRHDDHVVVDGGEGSTDRTVIAFVPPPLALRVEEGRDGSIHVTVTPTPGSVLSLLVAHGPPPRVAAAVKAARHLKAHAIQAASGPDEGLVLRSGVAEIDDGVQWLRARIGGQAGRAVRPSLPLALAAMAAGDQRAASTLLSLEGGSPAERALMAGRIASTFGDLGPASEAAHRWASGDAPPPSPMRTLAARALSRAVDRSIHPDVVARLSALASETAPAPADAGGGRRLPTVGRTGGAEADAGQRWWAALLSGTPTPPAPGSGSGATAEARRACAQFPDAPDAAWAAWRRLLVEAPPGGAPMLWDPPPNPPSMSAGEAGSGVGSEPDPEGGPSLAAELLLALTQGLLGVDADAPAGRLRLAPRFPSHLRAFSVGGIRVGESSVALEYGREGGRHVYRLSPETAPVPPLLVFEPSVEGRVSGVTVDGEAAELDAVAREGRTVVPVQLPLDRSRVVEVVT